MISFHIKRSCVIFLAVFRSFQILSCRSPSHFVDFKFSSIIKQQGVRRKMTSFVSNESKIGHNPYNFSWQQTMLRIKDPKVSVPYYENHFGFTLIHKYDFPQWNFALYFLAIIPEGEQLPLPGTADSESYLWSLKGTCLELTHNYGTENDENFQVNNRFH